MKEKDKELFLTSTLRVFMILFFGSLIMRIIGFDKFEFSSSGIVLDICKFLDNNKLAHRVVDLSFLTISSFLMYKLICKNTKTFIYIITAIVSTIANYFFQILVYNSSINGLYFVFSIAVLIMGVFVIDRKFNFIRAISILGLLTLYQGLCMLIRNITFQERFDLLYDLLLNFDYIILLVISYLIYEKKGRDYRWVTDLKVVGFFGDLLHLSKKSETKSQKQLLSKEDLLAIKGGTLASKEKLTIEERQEKLSEMIYLILSIIWNLFTIFCVIYVCTLNTTLITTIFLLTSFMITKTTFGEAFHMKSALSCFVVSNSVYFAVSRITVSVNTSFFVPIIIGIGISYVASLLVKKQSEDLYKGMDEEELREKCNKNGLNKYETNLLVDFYSKRYSLVKISIKYEYSKDTIYIHKKKAVQKIKGAKTN